VGRREQDADGALDGPDGCQLGVGQREPTCGRGSPATQFAGVEAVGVCKRPGRELGGRSRLEAESAGKRPPAVGGRDPYGGVVEVDR
jgi:hypothetical protein